MPSLESLTGQLSVSGESVDTFAPKPGFRPDMDKQESPSMAERFAVNNPVGSAMFKKAMLPGIDLYGAPKEGFDFSQYLDSPMRKEYAEFYIGAGSEDDMTKIDTFISEREDIKRRIAEDDSWSGLVSELAVGVADPFNLIPGGVLVKSATKGIAIAKSAGMGATSASGAMAASEVAIQSTAPERSIEESAINTAGALVLGSIIGGGIGALSKVHTKSLAEQIMDEVHFNKKPTAKINEDGSLSAAEATSPSNRMANQDRLSKTAEALLMPGFLKTTVVKGLNSKFKTTSDITDSFLDHNFTLEKHTQGRTSGLSAEAMIRQADDKLFKDMEQPLSKLFKEYIGVDADATGLAKIKGDFEALRNQVGKSQTNLDNFSKEIARELRSPGSSSNNSVVKAAGTLRKVMDDRVSKLMKHEEFKFLEDLTPEQRAKYLSRRWLRKRIIAEGKNGRFFKMLKSDISKHYKVGDEEAFTIASEAMDSMTRMSDDAIQMDALGFDMKGSIPKTTKARTLHFLDDNKYSEYLESDAISLTTHYAMSADRWLAHKSVLQRNGFESIVDVQKSLRDEYELSLANLERRANEISVDDMAKARKELVEEYESNQELINLESDLILGRADKNNRAISRFLGHVRKYNVLTMLGGLVLSAIPDVALQVAKHGIGPIAKELITPLVTDFKRLKLSMKELDQLAIAFDEQNNQVNKAFTDSTFRTGDLPTHWEKVSSVASEGFSALSLSKYWNGTGQRISGHMSSQFLIEAVRKMANGKQLSQKEIVRMAKGTISQDMAQRISKQFDQHGTPVGRGYLLNVSEWTDNEAIDAVTAFIRKEMDEVIIRPGLGDTPTYVKKYGAIGATQFQFQTFTSALVNKVVLPGIQDNRANMAIGFVMAIALGNLVEYIKSAQAGKEFKTEMDDILLQGMSRSGMMGLMGGAALSINPFGEYGTRYADRNITGMVLGPSLSTVQRISKLSGLSDGASNSDLKNLKSLVPYQNIFYLNRLLEEAFGIERNK